jgi:hypothetical protein
MWFILGLHNNSPIADTIIRPILTADTMFQSQASPCNICDRKKDSGRDFGVNIGFFPPLIFNPSMLHALRRRNAKRF